MSLNFNAEPYYDDYNESKNFHRILFKPGVAVQARELTQLQSILQNQIARFGKHIFKDGSVVLPGNTYLDKNYNYIKLQTQYNSADITLSNFADRTIKGQTTGMRAKVLHIEEATDTDPATLYVKYLDSGTSFTSTAFGNGETLLTDDGGTEYGAVTAASSATGKSIAASINTGVYFVRDSFVRVEANTIILDKYTTSANSKIGLSIVESFVSSDDDETLLDPAVGTYNYFAPGADRYQIVLELDSRDLNNTITSDTFIELMRVKEGELVSQVTGPGYNILADEMARRTYDESGNYTVEKFPIHFVEHERVAGVSDDGLVTTANGGNSQLAVAVVGPGKGYVRGYEIESISNKYLTVTKARDFDTTTNAIVRTPIGNYVYVNNVNSIPNFTTDLANVKLYSAYTSSNSAASGTLVGNARIRGFDFSSGNVMLSTGEFKTYLFDVKMDTGYTFDRDVKQLYVDAVSGGSYTANAFTADIVPTYTTITGTSNAEISKNVIYGVNTLFNTELKTGDYISLSTSTTPYRVATVVSNTQAYLTTSYTSANISGATVSRHTANIVDTNYAKLVFPLPVNVTKDITDVTYRTRRVFYGTLTGGSLNCTAAVTEAFSSIADTDFFAVSASGASKGLLYKINSSMVTQVSARSFTFDLSSYGLTNQDVLIYTTVIKSDPTVKTKTVSYNTVTYTSETDVKAAKIMLSNADVYELSNVKVSTAAFGESYTTAGETDITDRYVLDDGQRATYYDRASISKKPGKPLPAGPIKISYKYYAHGTGDFFRVDSYPDYENIPKFTHGDITYELRDCLDFRTRIDNTGGTFSGTGSSRNEFLDFANDYQADLQYYLARIDKAYLTSTGNVVYKEGTSSLQPVEPETPADAMPLYVVNVPAYTFDIKNDLTITAVDQKRYTMRDVGKLENRIKNLEYYTSLSLLELDTAVFTVKDQFGLDRFKNGFVVDAFTGHSTGDVRNPEYNISMDFQAGVLRPGVDIQNVRLVELNTSSSARTSNSYTLLNNTTIIPTYTEELYIQSTAASGDEFINPFDVYTFTGTMSLTPPGDVWFEETDKPLVYRNDDGTYDTLISDADGEKIYGTIWNSWKSAWYESSVTDGAQAIDSGIILTESNVTGDAKTAVIPFMRSATIRFAATGLKPNTKMYAFFENYDVTGYCYATTGDSVPVADNTTTNWNKTYGTMYTDQTGTLNGVFDFDPTSTGLKIPTGYRLFKITDSSVNSNTQESFAVQTFSVQGTLTKKNTVARDYIDVNLVEGYDPGDGGGSTSTNNGLDGYLSQFLEGAISTTEAAEILNKNGITDDLLDTYNPGTYGDTWREVLEYDSVVAGDTYVFQGVPPDTGGYVISGGEYAGAYVESTAPTNLWTNGYVDSVISNMSAEEFEFTAGIYNTIVEGMREQAVTGDWTAEQVAFYEVGVSNGSFAADDLDSVIMEYAAAATFGYLYGGSPADDADAVATAG